MGTCRFVYNKTLGYINDTDCPKNFMSLRNLFVTKEIQYKQCLDCKKIHKTSKKILKCCNDKEDNYKKCNSINENINDWEFNTPKEVRSHAIKDLIKGYKINFENLKRKNIKFFKMKYRKKKDNNHSIVIQKRSIHYINNYKNDKTLNNYLKIYSNSLGNIRIGKRDRKKNIIINNDCRIIFNGINYYIVIPHEIKEPKEYPKEKNVIAFDPGLRTFLMGYSQEEVLKIHTDNHKKLIRKLDLLNSLRSKKKLKNHKKIRKKRLKIDNIIDDLHWKTINYVTKEYKTILLPLFESQKMMSKNKKNNRDFMTLKHYQFRQRLINKVKTIKNTRLHIVTEEYTSKTCGHCGTIKYNLQGNKIYECSNCNMVMDRDINGSRNIFIKNVPPSAFETVKVL